MIINYQQRRTKQDVDKMPPAPAPSLPHPNQHRDIMAKLADINDSTVFPTISTVPGSTDLLSFYWDPEYYEQIKKDSAELSYIPRHRWCLLMEIIHIVRLSALQFVIEDKSGRQHEVQLYCGANKKPSKQAFQPGHTLAIPYAYIHVPLASDPIEIRQHGQVGIQASQTRHKLPVIANDRKVIPFDLHEILNACDQIGIRSTIHSKPNSCRVCGSQGLPLQRCPDWLQGVWKGCGLVWWCGKVSRWPFADMATILTV